MNIYYNTGDEKVRAAVVTSKGLVAWPLLQFTNGDQAAIAFRSDNKVVVAVSTYMENPPPPAPPVN